MNNSMPLVSVIMSVYNTPIDILRQSLNSLLWQTYKNIEIIVVNDCSEINYKELYDEYRTIVWLDNECNLGLTKSLNKAIKECNGKYIARMDSDDISDKNRIKKQVRFLEKHLDVSILGTWAKDFGKLNYLRANIPNNKRYLSAYCIFNSVLTHPTVMIRKSFLTKNNIIYNEKYRNSQDYDLWVRCLEFGDVIAEYPRCLLYYRISNYQISSQTNNSIQKKNAREIRINQIKKLCTDITDKECAIHNVISEGVYSELNSKEKIDGMILWVEKLLKSNKSQKKYSNGMFRLVVAEQLYPIISNKDVSFTFKQKLKIYALLRFRIIEAVFAKMLRRIVGYFIREYKE